jgi:hypothetical protein
VSVFDDRVFRALHAALLAFFGLTATHSSAVAQSVPEPSYRALWIAVPNSETVSISVKEKEWSPLLSFRPAQTFVLKAPAIEVGKKTERLSAGTRMVAMNEGASIACQLERPKGRYFIGCIEDFDRDGGYEGFFLLNHANPFLFSALRQPRHNKHWSIAPVTLGSAMDSEIPEVKMVFLFDNRAELAGRSQFQLCVMREGVKNIWGDATHARGCLPTISIKDGGEPVSLSLYGRNIVISAPEVGVGKVTMSAQPKPVQVEL